MAWKPSLDFLRNAFRQYAPGMLAEGVSFRGIHKAFEKDVGHVAWSTAQSWLKSIYTHKIRMTAINSLEAKARVVHRFFELSPYWAPNAYMTEWGLVYRNPKTGKDFYVTQYAGSDTTQTKEEYLKAARRAFEDQFPASPMQFLTGAMINARFTKNVM